MAKYMVIYTGGMGMAASPEELDNLTVQLASQDTFRRYDLDRPGFLNSLQFEVVSSGSGTKPRSQCGGGLATSFRKRQDISRSSWLLAPCACFVRQGRPLGYRVQVLRV